MGPLSLSFTASPEHVSDGPEVVDPPADGFARPRQGDVAPAVTSAVEAAAPATLVVGLGSLRHFARLKCGLFPVENKAETRVDLG